MKQGERIAKSACEWLGTPYMDNAMVKGVGVDCAHLLLASVLGAGLLQEGDVHIEQYSNEWHLHRSEEKFLQHIEKVAEEVPLREMQVGDILLYQYGRCISHGAILVARDLLIHAYVGEGVILSNVDDIIFRDNAGKSRLRKAYRFKGIKE